MSMIWKNHQGLIVLTAIYFITFILMLPLRNVAFEDDFTYIKTAENLVKTGHLKIEEFVGVALIFQTFWGAFFAKVFGLSIKTLDLSNVVLFYFGLIAFYLTLKRLNLGQWRSLLFTIFLLGFPWVFQFTYSFMSDVFYLSLFLISAYFYVSALQTRSKFFYILGSFVAGLAFIQRQNAIIIPLAATIPLIFLSITSKKIYWREFIFSFLPFACIVVLYFIWLYQTGPTLGQIKMVQEPLQKQFLPKLFPHDLKRSIALTQQYYLLALIKRGLAYFDNTIVFLTPIILIYNFRPKQLLKSIKVNIHFILITASIIGIAYYIDWTMGRTYTSHIPGLILRYVYNFTDNWKFWWPKLIWIARIVWVFIIAITIKKIIYSLFIKNEKLSAKKAFKKLAQFYFIILLFIFFGALYSNFPFVFSLTRISIAIKSLTSLPHLLANLGHLLAIQQVIINIKYIWFFLVVIFSITTFATYIITTQKLRNLSPISQSLLFLGSALTFSFLTNCFFTRAFYEEYIIQFIPLVIIGLAYLFKNTSISLPKAIAIASLLLFFSLSGTRERNQIEGTKWQLGNQLVEQGVDPYNIAVNWPWRPYWYANEAIAKVIQKYGGDKYKVPQGEVGGWSGVDEPGVNYRFVMQPANFSTPPNLLPVSEPFWIFGQGRVRLVTNTYIIK